MSHQSALHEMVLHSLRSNHVRFIVRAFQYVLSRVDEILLGIRHDEATVFLPYVSSYLQLKFD
jgi:hypothetical protein